MEHNTCRENLSAYLDGELSGEEKLSLESHLAVCHDCSRELAELKQVSAVFKKHAMQPAPLSLKDAVFAEKPAAPFFSSWLKPAAAFAAAAAGLLIILALPKTREREQAASPEFFYSARPASTGISPSAYKEEAALSAPAADSAEGFESASLSAAASAGGAGGGISGEAGRRYTAAAAARGSYGQAKFSGGSLSKKSALTAPAASVPLTGDPAISAFFAEGNKAKRAAPSVVPDIVSGGVRFSAAHWRKGGARPLNGGSVKAFSALSGELLWEGRVYEVPEDPRLETDVQQVHISALALNAGALVIADERGNRYRLDLRTRKAEPLPR